MRKRKEKGGRKNVKSLRREKERRGKQVDSLKKRKGQSKNERGECKEDEKTEGERKW